MVDLKQRKNKDMRKREKLSEDKQDNNWKKNGLNNIKKLYDIKDRFNKDNISHIKVFLNIEPEDKKETPEIKLITPPDIYKEYKIEKKVDDEIKIGSEVQWTNSKNETMSGTIHEITKNKN